MKRILTGLLLWLAAVPALGQSVQQSGTVTPGHVARWTTNGIVQDGGTAANGNLTSVGILANGTGLCQNSAAITSVGYQQFCLGVTTTGGATISLQNFGTATAQSISFNINGTVITLPGGGSGGTDTFATITLPVTDGSVICASGTAGTLAGCTPGITVGGTGATTAAGARTNLGLGSIATQSAAAVAITGGSITSATVTGLPAPSASSDAATKGYVDATATGLRILGASTYATAAVLPNTPTYSNGASGVGATLTAGSNTTLTVDGTVAALNSVVLVKDQAAPAQNGQYYVSTAGSGAAPWVLTRCTAAACSVKFDNAATMTAGSYTFVSAGATNVGKSYVLQATVTTVGTDPASFILFSNVGNPVTSLNAQTGALNWMVSVGGRLTLTSGTPITTTDVTGAATVYWTPFDNNYIQIYNGSVWVQYAFAELSCILDAIGHIQNTNYDVYAYVDTGAVACGFGPAWTTGSGSATARGTGAGSTAVELLNGRYVNTNAIVLRNNSVNSSSVSANQAVLLGTVRIGSIAGQTEDSMARRFLSNVYNAIQRELLRVDTTDTWDWSAQAYRQAAGNAANQFEYVQAIAGRPLEADVFGAVFSTTATYRSANVGIGISSTTVNSSTRQWRATINNTLTGQPAASYNGYPGIGYYQIVWLEAGAGADAQIWRGDDGTTLPNLTIQTGMAGHIFN